MTQILDSKNLQYCKTQNQIEPQEGPTAVPVPGLDFSVVDTYTLDMSNDQAQGKFTAFQGVFVDNAGNGSPLSITMQGLTGQRLLIPAGAQAYLPVLSVNPVKLVFHSAGGVPVPVSLLNFPVGPCVWIP